MIDSQAEIEKSLNWQQNVRNKLMEVYKFSADDIDPWKCPFFDEQYRYAMSQSMPRTQDITAESNFGKKLAEHRNAFLSSPGWKAEVDKSFTASGKMPMQEELENLNNVANGLMEKYSNSYMLRMKIYGAPRPTQPPFDGVGVGRTMMDMLAQYITRETFLRLDACGLSSRSAYTLTNALIKETVQNYKKLSATDIAFVPQIKSPDAGPDLTTQDTLNRIDGITLRLQEILNDYSDPGKEYRGR